jgi:hypothetical protein
VRRLAAAFHQLAGAVWIHRTRLANRKIARPPATFGTIAYRDPAISFCVHLKFEIFNLKSPVPLQALQNRPNVA